MMSLPGRVRHRAALELLGATPGAARSPPRAPRRCSRDGAATARLAGSAHTGRRRPSSAAVDRGASTCCRAHPRAMAVLSRVHAVLGLAQEPCPRSLWPPGVDHLPELA